MVYGSSFFVRGFSNLNLFLELNKNKPTPAPKYINPPRTTGFIAFNKKILDRGMLIPYNIADNIANKEYLFNFKHP